MDQQPLKGLPHAFAPEAVQAACRAIFEVFVVAGLPIVVDTARACASARRVVPAMLLLAAVILIGVAPVVAGPMLRGVA